VPRLRLRLRPTWHSTRLPVPSAVRRPWTRSTPRLPTPSVDICAAQVYTVAAGDQMLIAPVIGSIKAVLFTNAAVVSHAEADVAPYQIIGAKCGQATLDEEHASAAKSFAGLSEGICAAQGYTVPDGDQTLDVLVIGSGKVGLFTKAAMVSQAEAGGTRHKFVGAKGGQATLDEKYASAAKPFAGSSVGACAGQGYTVPAGDLSLSVPVIGVTKVELFT
jgi:hypothetical protein